MKKSMNWMDVDQAAEYLQVKKSTMYFWTHKGMIPFYRLGRKLMFRQSELDDFILMHRCGPVRVSQGIEIED